MISVLMRMLIKMMLIRMLMEWQSEFYLSIVVFVYP
jgi:hypothetical protein